MATTVLYILIGLLIFDFAFELWLDYLNNRNSNTQLPSELSDVYEPEKYARSIEYEHETSKFSNITSSLSTVIMLVILFGGVFGWIDDWVRQYFSSPITVALAFFGVFGFASGIFGIPFELYRTFVIEEKYGFNRTTIKTYITDKIKGSAISIILGSGLLALVIWFYETSGEYFWLYAWILFTAVMLFMTMFYASVFLPIFNKLTPLDEGPLRTAIETYCKKAGFTLDNLFVMDGSKRSAKSNAFFSGLGPKKQIVLYDTLIEKHTTEELVAVLAHEIGHYKKKHIPVSMAIGVIQTGLMLFILGQFVGSPVLSQALGASVPSFHVGMIAFGMLFSPISFVLGIGMNLLSRKNEYEADKFAAETYSANALISALKKLSSDNLSNLTPHPLYVFFHYSHPTLLQRVRAISNIR